MGVRKPLGRRSFVKKCALGSAGLVAIGTPGVAGAFVANERIRLGAIGTGGRCRRVLIPSAQKCKGVEVTAVCDVQDQRIEQARALIKPSAFFTRYHEKILERKDIDGVLIGTSDHWHVPITIDACAAGKDVYVEKPLTHNPSDGPAVIDAQNTHKRIIQVGMQQRSMPQFQKAREIVRSGKLGAVHKVHLTWNRNMPIHFKRYGTDPKSVDWKRYLGRAPDQPFNEWRLKHFRWFWDFGGGILTDLMVHYIDVANWLLDLKEPTTAMTIGDHFQSKGVWETPDTMQSLFTYPEQQVQLYFEGTFSNARNRAMLEFMGTDATLYLDRGRYEIYPEKDSVKYEQFSPGKSERGADFDAAVKGGLMHMQNFIDCMRSREKPRAPAEVGVLAVTSAHLGNHAYRTGKVAHWADIAP